MVKRIVIMNWLEPVFYLEVDVPHDNFDLEDAAQKAVAEYAKTPEGEKVMKSQNGRFNWGNLVDIPVDLCKKFGFEIVASGEVDFSPDLKECIEVEHD